MLFIVLRAAVTSYFLFCCPCFIDVFYIAYLFLCQ